STRASRSPRSWRTLRRAARRPTAHSGGHGRHAVARLRGPALIRLVAVGALLATIAHGLLVRRPSRPAPPTTAHAPAPHRTPAGAPRATTALARPPGGSPPHRGHIPVVWAPGGAGGFAGAGAEPRPFLPRTGSSPCHWCHVMAEESFEDEEIAAYLNEHYVA